MCRTWCWCEHVFSARKIHGYWQCLYRLNPHWRRSFLASPILTGKRWARCARSAPKTCFEDARLQLYVACKVLPWYVIFSFYPPPTNLYISTNHPARSFCLIRSANQGRIWSILHLVAERARLRQFIKRCSVLC